MHATAGGSNGKIDVECRDTGQRIERDGHSNDLEARWRRARAFGADVAGGKTPEGPMQLGETTEPTARSAFRCHVRSRPPHGAMLLSRPQATNE